MENTENEKIQSEPVENGIKDSAEGRENETPELLRTVIPSTPESEKCIIDVNKSIYSNARACAVKILVRCERSDAYLEKLIETEFKNTLLNDFDKSLLNELTHGVIRWLRRLDWFLNGFYRGQYEKCLSDVKNAMRVALYQILFLNKIPYSAAVNEAVEFVKKVRGDKLAGVVNGLLRTIIRTLDALVWPTREIDEVNYLGIIQSHPNWIVRRWISRFGFDEAQKLCEANNKRPFLTIRVNRSKIKVEDFYEHMHQLNLTYSQCCYLDYFFTTKMMNKIYNDEFFKKGYFTIQDESAGLVSHLVAPREGDLILDVCAAPGGKTSHMSELTNNRCKIIAIDKYLSRVETMKRNFERFELSNILAFHEDVSNPRTDLMKSKIIGKVDKVLVDAPCSGLGVLSKKPDIKWKREPKDIYELQALQLELLERASEYVKPRGVLVYSTCTIETDENIDVVNKFLQKHSEYELDDAGKFLPAEVVGKEKCMELLPHVHNTDGAFAARLIKKS